MSGGTMGTVKQRSNGRWEARIDVPGGDPASGQRRQRSKSYGTKKEAVAQLQTWNAEFKEGNLAEPSRVTLRTYLEDDVSCPTAGDCVGCVDCGVDGEAGGGDRAPSLQLVDGGGEVLVRLAGVRADLRSVDGASAGLPRHSACPSGRPDRCRTPRHHPAARRATAASVCEADGSPQPR
jgi:hypothetical protein